MRHRSCSHNSLRVKFLWFRGYFVHRTLCLQVLFWLSPRFNVEISWIFNFDCFQVWCFVFILFIGKYIIFEKFPIIKKPLARFEFFFDKFIVFFPYRWVRALALSWWFSFSTCKVRWWCVFYSISFSLPLLLFLFSDSLILYIHLYDNFIEFLLKSAHKLIEIFGVKFSFTTKLFLNNQFHLFG